MISPGTVPARFPFTAYTTATDTGPNVSTAWLFGSWRLIPWAGSLTVYTVIACVLLMMCVIGFGHTRMKETRNP